MASQHDLGAWKGKFIFQGEPAWVGAIRRGTTLVLISKVGLLNNLIVRSVLCCVVRFALFLFCCVSFQIVKADVPCAYDRPEDRFLLSA